MQPRLSLITLVVDDLEGTRRFYCEKLGWPAEVDVPAEVLMIRVGERLLLSLWQRDSAEAEIGAVTRTSTPPVTLAHNVATEAEVEAVLAEARDAGAAVAPASRRDWGGYSGYFTDPDGFRWEVAVNPTPLGESLLP